MLLRKSLLLCWLLIALTACQPVAIAPTQTPTPAEQAAPVGATNGAVNGNLSDGCLDRYNADVDYFPDKVTPLYAEGFAVEYQKHYKVVTVKTPWQGATEQLQYALVQCGAPAPAGFADNEIITVPVQRFVSMSTTYLPVLEQLGLLDRLVGLDDITYVNNETVRAMDAAGKLKYIGYGGNLNIEQALDLDPDLIMTYAVGGSDADAHPQLLAAGLKVAVEASWLDTSPLGRAEWSKFIALFFNKEAEAETLFAATAARYEELAALAAQAASRPTVFTDSVFQGTWYMPGGKSYFARYIADAGGQFLWADDETSGSLPLSFEAVLDRAQQGEIWLNLGFINSLDELLALDARYSDFAAFQSDQVWNNNARVNSNGGSDYYESGSANPDVVLADLIKIFHPELLPEHELVYYRQLQ